MLKVLMSDLHFGSNQNSRIFLEMQINFFRKFVIPYMRRRGIDTLEILGDFFHHKELTDNNVKKEVWNLICHELRDFKIRMLLGNHDIYYRDSLETHSLHFIEDLPNVEIINSMCVIEEGNANQLYVPWIIDNDLFKKNFSELTETNDINTVMGHFEMKGFPLNKLHGAKHGADVDELDLSKISNVFSGHYHTPSKRMFGDCSWQYLGSPFQHTRIDGGDKKGFVVFDTETLEYEFVYSESILEFKTIEYSPKKTELPDVSEIKGNSVDIMVYSNDVGKADFEKFFSIISGMGPSRIEKKVVPSSLVGDDVDDGLVSDDGEVKGVIDLVKDYLVSTIKDEEMRLSVLEKIVEINEEAEESLLQSEMTEIDK